MGLSIVTRQAIRRIMTFHEAKKIFIELFGQEEDFFVGVDTESNHQMINEISLFSTSASVLSWGDGIQLSHCL